MASPTSTIENTIRKMFGPAIEVSVCCHAPVVAPTWFGATDATTAKTPSTTMATKDNPTRPRPRASDIDAIRSGIRDTTSWSRPPASRSSSTLSPPNRTASRSQVRNTLGG